MSLKNNFQHFINHIPCNFHKWFCPGPSVVRKLTTPYHLCEWLEKTDFRSFVSVPSFLTVPVKLNITSVRLHSARGHASIQYIFLTQNESLFLWTFLFVFCLMSVFMSYKLHLTTAFKAHGHCNLHGHVTWSSRPQPHFNYMHVASNQNLTTENCLFDVFCARHVFTEY